MPVRFLSDAQREQLSGFPAELEPESLDRFFTLSGPDLAEVRRRHGDENRLGWSLQLCGLRMLGFCPDDVTTAPPSAVRFVARQLGVDPGVLEGACITWRCASPSPTSWMYSCDGDGDGGCGEPGRPRDQPEGCRTVRG